SLHPLCHLPTHTPFSTFSSYLLITRPPPRSTLFPYTTLFRSLRRAERDLLDRGGARVDGIGIERAGRPVARPERDLHAAHVVDRSEEHTSELQSLTNLVCRLLLEKKKQTSKRDCA